MIRTQVYLDDQIHKDLIRLAQQENKSMAEVTRDILKEGITKKKTIDTSGKTTLQKLFAIQAIDGDDPENTQRHRDPDEQPVHAEKFSEEWRHEFGDQANFGTAASSFFV